MKLRPLLLTLSGVSAAAAAVLALSAMSSPVAALPPQVLPAAPEECACSRGLRLADGGASVLHNCQCGPLQCVVHAPSGNMQCR
ncbi:MAG: hypothetical protein ABTQ28_09310 [Thauera sp.]